MKRRTDRKGLGLWAAQEQDGGESRPVAAPATKSRGEDGRQAMTAMVRLAQIVERVARRERAPATDRKAATQRGRAGLRAEQRVVVKVSYSKHNGRASSGALRAHLRYVQRDGVSQEAERGVLYDSENDALLGVENLREWDRDPHHFRVILSPDNGHQIADFNAYVRSVMANVERQLGTKLQWVAVNHFNTDNPHAHVVIRGRTERGQVLRLPREFVKQGFRQIAQGVATEMLGHRRTRELVESAGRDVWQSRLTSLDRILFRSARQGRIDFRQRLSPFTEPYRQVMHARLHQLERLGVARRLAPDGAQWELGGDMIERLRALGERQDIIKNLHRAAGRQAYAAGELKAASVDGRGAYRVIASGRMGEGRGERFVVLEGPGGVMRYARPARVTGGGKELERGTTVRAGVDADGRIVLSRSRETQRKATPAAANEPRRSRRARAVRV
jgi:type IV secretory pathway VirD2 relaxase